MPSAELAANLFRATQTEEQLAKLREQGIQGKDAANKTHFEIGKKEYETRSGKLGAPCPKTTQQWSMSKRLVSA